ncbi:ClpP/crotonase-like domain-containing protein [Fennellomyces sp. T-0311]|nr:ClpP/crotonase-like domain-containing protein [Fennellomyces sp. T-0311]
MSFPVALPSSEKHFMTLHHEGPLYILHLHNNENRFTTEVCNAILHALQIIEDTFIASEDPVDMALITVGEGKFYSNGLDLLHASTTYSFIDTYVLLLKRLLTFCVPTVAALNGHAFAGGCLFALAHDYRVMRTDRGFLCMNEVDLPAPLAPGFTGLCRYKMTPQTFRDTILQARRYTAQEALENQLVDVICPQNQVLDKAKELALKWAPKAKSGIVYKQLKEEMYTDVIRLLSIPLSRRAKFKL